MGNASCKTGYIIEEHDLQDNGRKGCVYHCTSRMLYKLYSINTHFDASITDSF